MPAYDPGVELWERREALDSLERLLRDSAAGGRVALVGGEAGIGKSSLVGEFARRCGTRVLWGACDSLVTPRALGPPHDIGRDAGGRLAQLLGGGAGPEELFAAFLDELAGAATVVVVEDVHWADEATLDWLTFLGRRIARLPALLVVTYRDDEVGPDHPLRRTLAALPSALTASVPIAPLSHECVLKQARLSGVDGETVYRRAGGNPLLVTELMKTDAPVAVENLILERLRLLPPAARELAHLVSVVPTRADAAVDGTDEAVDVAFAAGVLVPSGDGVAFRHELLRSTVERSLSPVRRAALHRRVLAALEAAPGADPSRLAHHARSAGDAAAVLRYARLAGTAAARQGAHREAADHLTAAAAVAGELDRPERADLLERLGHAAYLAGRIEQAIDARQQALRLREELGQPSGMGENLRWLSRTLWWAGRRGEGHRAAERAVEVLETAPPGAELARAYAMQAQLQLTAHHLTDAARWARRARDLADRIGDGETLVQAEITLGVAEAHRDFTSLDGLWELNRAAEAAGLTEQAARAAMNPAISIADEFAWYDEHAVDLHERAMRYLEEHDLDGYVVYLLGSRARLRLERGEWAGALADADTALGSDEVTLSSILPALVRGRILAARGAEDARSTLDEAARLTAAADDVVTVAPIADARAELLHWSGDTPGAQRVVREGLRDTAGLEGVEFLVGRLAYRLHRLGGETLLDGVAEPYRWMIEGDWRRAEQEWGRRGGVLLRAEALSLGDEAAAGEALRILDGLEATRAADFLRAELRKRGVVRVPRGPRRTTKANVAGLTPRQVDVLALIAEGLSNAEIAARLTLSPKTVDHHISAVLAKLGVTSRGQAAAEARRLELPT